MWPLMLGKKPLKCQEKASGLYKNATNHCRGGRGSAPDPAGELTTLLQTPSWWGGDWLPLPKNSTPALGLRPFGPRLSPPRIFKPPPKVKSYIRP